MCITLAMLACSPIGNSASRNDNQLYSCKKAAPEAFTDDLNIQSKYDQSDKTKSKLSETRNSHSADIQRQINDFTKGLVKFTNYVSASDERKRLMAQKCLHSWLTAWATDEALTSQEATKTGKAARKWALASINASIIKTIKLTNGSWRLSQIEKTWLSQLADLVIHDYDKRLTTNFKYYNNHDHWAAWAVFSSGYLLKDKRYMDWAHKGFNKALTLAKTDYKGKYAYFPIELARSHLALNYTHFSLTPLIMLNYYLPKAGYSISDRQTEIMSQLVNFAAASILRSSEFSSVLQSKQTSVALYKLAWVIPYLAENKSHVLAKKLFNKFDGEMDGYSMIGGRISSQYKGK